MGGCSPYQELLIQARDTDGNLVSVNLLNNYSGFCLKDDGWNPTITVPKDDGVWRSSMYADGRTLAVRSRSNDTDTLTLVVRNYSPDDLIRDTQDLRRLLEQAYSYDTTKWMDRPVWIKRWPVFAEYPEYSIIKDYRTPQDGNPHGSNTFWTNLAQAAFPEFILTLEHEPWWRGDEPGTGTCVQTSAEQEDWAYEGWAINTAQPTREVVELLDAACGNMLACDPQGPEIWRTANGTVWNAAVTPPAVAPYALVDASDGFIYAACIGQVWRSGDCGVNWVQRNAAFGVNSNNSICEHTDGFLYIASQGSEQIRRSNDGGATWNIVFDGPPVPLAIISASDGYLYCAASYWDGAFVLRSQNGTTWTQVAEFGPAVMNFRMIRELDDGYIYTGGWDGSAAYGYRSANGTDWAQNFYVAQAARAEAIVHASFDDNYYMLLTNGHIYRSPNAIDWVFVIDIGGVVVADVDMIEYGGNNRIYAGEGGNIWWGPSATVTVGRTATCADEVFVTNQANVAQLTNIWVYDASGPAYTAQFPAGAFPYQLLPNPMANGDAVYFGIDQAVAERGPFSNLVFDITTEATGTFSLTWQYSDGVGGWPTLNVKDGTGAFMISGVNSVHWVPPAAWTTEAVNGVTALWVRAIVSLVSGNPVGPQQGNRDVYTCNWPHVDIDEAQVLGDIAALMQFKFRNRSDEDGYESILDELDTLENRVIVGLRSLWRGESHIPYLNCSDEQNPPGVTVTNGVNTSFVNDIDHPTGRSMQHTTTGVSTWTDECTFTLSPTIAGDFYGSFHAYFRAQEVDRSAAMDEVRVRLQVRTGSGGVTFTTNHQPFPNLNDWQLLDFGGVDIPASGLLSSSDLGDESAIVVQIWSSQAALTVNLYDVILIPTDEWGADLIDKALEDDSGVTDGYLLDADSVTYPKRDIRALVRTGDSGAYIRSIYQPNTVGAAILQANVDQRLWFLTARAAVYGTHTGGNNVTTLTDSAASFLTSAVETGQVIFNITDGSVGTVGATVTATTITDCGLAGGADNDWDTNDEYLIIAPNWRSEPWNTHSLQVWNVPRYLSMRGPR